ncbi:Alanine dehydrogenase [Catalinimonas alkaloidigena]|uniref:Saccharopine dehydrogenase [NAD(+), L-lysine-forming] n=1 Tax=Catalinimonas alkaloidigena TaxID=1075417 RepID=A0A1G9DKG2_9BACT|nr:NAD(P)-dependent oxidoreductase [Catalinimonas alkaloidigena]SDK64423.1 Alanine dehydrogenase [Catalinimonas alkaloidigena]
MTAIKIGILAEGKVPIDRRVPLTPLQCVEVQEQFPGVKVVVQASPIRCFGDEQYREVGIAVEPSVADCPYVFGVKEVPIDQLIENKTYFFFSHTTKKQPYNQALLQTVLQRHITLVDYEHLTDGEGRRIIAFGRYAGLVGTYNALLTYGTRFGLFTLKPAHQCFDLEEIWQELAKVQLPPVKIVVTGAGRVGKGAVEILDAVHVRRVSPEEFLAQQFDVPVFTQLHSRHYYRRLDGKDWNDVYFYNNPADMASVFGPYANAADVLVAGAYWDPRAPRLFTLEDVANPAFRLKVIADITCDIEGSIPTTVQASTIEMPQYDFDPLTRTVQRPFSHERHVTVMAVDNLPCELPRDASRDFGRQLIDNVLPALLLDDPTGIIQRATIAQRGHLTPPYHYLKDYAFGTEM